MVLTTIRCVDVIRVEKFKFCAVLSLESHAVPK